MKKLGLASLALGALCGIFSTTITAEDWTYQQPWESKSFDWSFSGGQFNADVDWLYWTIKESNLAVGTAITVTPGTDTVPESVSTKTIRPHFNFDSGVRASVGYELPCKQWEIGVSYTYLPGHGTTGRHTTDATGQNGPQFILLNTADYALLSEIIPGGIGVSSLSAKWNANINNLDVDVARTINIGESFYLRPHIGFRACWLNQKYTIDSIISVEVDPAVNDDLFTKFKEDFQGYGVEGGFWADWNLGCGLSLLGHVGGSILYSNFKIHRNIVATRITDTGDIDEFNAHSHDHFESASPTFDYFIGLEYTNCLWNMEYRAHIGWEQHFMWDINHIARNGNLSTQGLTLGAGFTF